MKFSINGFMGICVVSMLVTGSIACNGTDSSDKTKDSLSTAADSVKAADSAKVVKAKKRKGRTSVSGFIADSAKMVKDIHGVYNRVEKAPEFPGGQAALADYFNKNITYPQSAVDNGTIGTIRVAFVVDEHGKVVDPTVVGGNQLGDGLSDEALTAFNKMPLWTPGMVHGKKVKTRLVLPITFELADAE